MSSVKKKSKSKLEKASRKPSESSTVSSVEPSFLKSPVDHVYDTADENDFDEESYMLANDGSLDHEEWHNIDPNDPKYAEAVEKELDRKIEQAPAAKVIVSDAMMRKALGEIESSRRSSRSIVNKGSGVQAQSHDDGAGGDGDASNVIRSESQGGAEAAAVAAGGVEEASAAEEELNGCPLDKILEFLQAVMTKDYKRALVLAKEVEQLEPNNELIQEYMVVLKKIVRKEREDEEQDSESDAESGSENEGAVYSDELTTSTETESVSGDDSEESKTSRSTTYYSSTGEDEDDVEEEEVVVEEKVITTWNNNNDDVSQGSLVQAESLRTEVIKDASDTEKTSDAHLASVMTEGGGDQSVGAQGVKQKAKAAAQMKSEGEKKKKVVAKSKSKKPGVKGSK